MGPHVLDFYCAEARYNLELDGGRHGFPEQQTKDLARDAYLMSRNIQTRRFWNSQLKDVRWLRETIWTDLQSRAPHLKNARPDKPARMEKLHDQPSATPHPVLSQLRGEGISPVRAELIKESETWPFCGAIIPGYPKLHPLEEDFWSKFWKLYLTARAPDAGNRKLPPRNL